MTTLKSRFVMGTGDESSGQQVKIEKGNALLGTLVIVFLAVALLALVGFLFLKPKSDLIEGQAEATSVRISGKLPGRVVELYVEEGQQVKAGDTLVHIHSSLAEAKLYQAEAMENELPDKVEAVKQVEASGAAKWETAEARPELEKVPAGASGTATGPGTVPKETK